MSKKKLDRECIRKDDWYYSGLEHIVYMYSGDKYHYVLCDCGLYSSEQEIEEDALWCWDNGTLWYTDTGEEAKQLCWRE